MSGISVRRMKRYLNQLTELAKDKKCHTCISMQTELRTLIKEIDNWRLQAQISQLLKDHDLHEHPGCEECHPEKARQDFLERATNDKV
jgi:hypothetical protein